MKFEWILPLLSFEFEIIPDYRIRSDSHEIKRERKLSRKEGEEKSFSFDISWFCCGFVRSIQKLK